MAGNRPGGGSGSGSQAGSGSQGTSGQGQGTQIGRPGQSGTFAGHGTTNLGGKSGPMPGNQGAPNMQDPSKKPNWEEKFQSIYAPEFVAHSTQDTQIHGKRGDTGKTYSTIIRSAPEKQAARAPYYQVYQDYEAAAEEALTREDIPRGYKTYVREYFDALRPEEGK